MTQITAQLTSRKDTAANWASANPVLALAEHAFTTDVFYTGTDQMKFKVGDGVQTWSQLDYMPIGTSSTPTLQQVLTAGATVTQDNSINGASFDLEIGTNASPFHGININIERDFYLRSGIVGVNNSSEIGVYGGTLTPSAYISSTSDAGTTYTFFAAYGAGQTVPNNGTNNAFLIEDTVSSKGLVYYGDYSANFTPESLISKRYITNLLGASNGIASLDASGKVPTAQLPAIALTDVYVVNSQAAQLALTAEEGDVAVRTDLNKSYIHNGGTAGTMADWQELLTPTDAVLSVNGLTGAVTLTSTNIAEGTNLYFTNARAVTALTGQSNTIFTNGAGYITAYKVSFPVGWTTAINPADSSTYFFGALSSIGAAVSATGGRKFVAPITGFATDFKFMFNSGTVATNETSDFVLVNETQSTSVTMITTATIVAGVFSSPSFSLAVNEGDVLSCRWVTPAWVTNPTSNQISGVILFSNT